MVRPIDMQSVLSKVQQVEEVQQRVQHGLDSGNAKFAHKLEEDLAKESSTVSKISNTENDNINPDDDSKKGARGVRIAKRRKKKTKAEPSEPQSLYDKEGHLDIKV